MSKYMDKINSIEEYNEYRENENNKHLEKLLEDFKKKILDETRIDSAVNACKQFIHDCECYEQQIAICGEIRRTLKEIEIDFEEMEGK